MNAISNKTISNRQFVFAISSFIFGSTLLSCFIVGVTKQDSWFVIICGAIVGLLVAQIYLSLMNMYPGKTLIEVNELTLGKVLGRILSVLYLSFFLMDAMLNTRDLGNFVIFYILPETPLAVVLALFIGACSFAVYKGIRTIINMGFIFFVLYLSGLAISFLLLFNLMDFSNLSPSFTLPLIDYVQGTHIVATIPFGEIIFFTMAFKHLEDQKKVKKTFIISIVISAVAMVFVAIKDCSVLGKTAQLVAQPTYQGDTLINYGTVISRAEILFSIIFISMLFYKISITFYAFAYGVEKLCRIRSYKPFVATIGVVIVCGAILIYDSSMENLYFGPNIAPVLFSLFLFIMPSIMLIVAKAKKNKEKFSSNKAQNN